jgi:membrane protease YdiL (CAAX protease family)
MEKIMKRFPVLFFLIVTFLVSYVLGILVFLLLEAIQAGLGINLSNVSDIVIRFGPTLGGILTVAFMTGKNGLRDLLRQCIRWQVPAVLYLAAIFVPPIFLVLALHLNGFGAEVTTVGLVPAISVFVFQLLLNTFLGGGFGEELGWRGFMLPKLSERYNPLTASLIVGIAWLAWHLPGYLLSDKSASDPFLPFAVILFPFSIALSWIYFQSRESLLLPALLHGSINGSFYALEKLLPNVIASANFQPAFDWTTAGLWVVLAGIVVAWWRLHPGKHYEPGQQRQASNT